MRKRFLAALLSSLVLLTVPISAAGEEAWLAPASREVPVFTDLTDSWCRDYAETVCRTGLMEGYPDGRFGPGDPLTTAQTAVIAARCYDLLTGGDGTLPAGEENDPWYQCAYAALAPLLGFEGCEDLEASLVPSNDCYRATFVELLAIVLEKAGVALPAINSVSALPDVGPEDASYLLSHANAYAGVKKSWHEAVLSFYNAGILQGVDAYGTLSSSPLTRGEAAAMLARLLDPSLRLAFTLEPFDLCRDVLGLPPDSVVAVIGGDSITADQFSYAFAVRFTSGLIWEERMDLAAALPDSAENALAFLKRETAAVRLAQQLGYLPTEEALAALDRRAAEQAGYGGLSEAAWQYELRRTAAVDWVYAYFCDQYGYSSPLMHVDGGESYLVDQLYDVQRTLSADFAPPLEKMDWPAVARRIAASPYAGQEILYRPMLCGYIPG